MKKNLMLLLSFLLTIAALYACSNGHCNNTYEDTKEQGTVLTIDYTVDIPIINGTIADAGFSLRNNTNQNIKNIKYTINTNIQTSGAITPDNLCTNIPANSSCFIPINQTAINNSDTFYAGTIVLTANYSDITGPHKISSMLRFKNVANRANGLYFSSSLLINGRKNKQGYAIGYIYAGGKTGTIYRIKNLNSKKGMVKLLSSLPSDVIAAGTIIQFKIKASTNTIANYSDELQLTYSQINNNEIQALETKKLVTSNVQILSDNTANFSYIMPSLNNMVNLSNDASPQTIFFNNIGSIKTSLGNLTISKNPSAITILKNTCLNSLNIDDICEINYKILNSKSSGQAIFQLAFMPPYPSSFASSIVSWYSITGPELIINPMYSTLTFSKNNSGIINYQITNLKKEPVILDKIYNTIIQGKGSAIIADDLCSNTILSQNDSCTFSVLVTDTSPSAQERQSNGLIYLNVNGTGSIFKNPIQLTGIIQYSSTFSMAQLAVSITPSDHIWIPNSFSTWKDDRTINFSNIGDTQLQQLSGNLITPLPEYSNIAIDNCNNSSLNAGESCHISIQFHSPNNHYGESGVIKYHLQNKNDQIISNQANIFYSIADNKTILTAFWKSLIVDDNGRTYQTITSDNVNNALHLENQIQLPIGQGILKTDAILIDDGGVINPWIWQHSPNTPGKYIDCDNGLDQLESVFICSHVYTNRLFQQSITIPFTTTDFIDFSSQTPNAILKGRQKKPLVFLNSSDKTIHIYQPQLSSQMKLLNPRSKQESLEITFRAIYPPKEKLKRFPITIEGNLLQNISFHPDTIDHLMPGIQKDANCTVSSGLQPNKDPAAAAKIICRLDPQGKTSVSAKVILPINPLLVTNEGALVSMTITKLSHYYSWMANATPFIQIKIESMPLPKIQN